MNEKQDRLYWREWGALSRRCKAEGWTLPDRHELHARALGRNKSHTSFTNPDFDQVLGVFRSYSQAENMNAQVRQQRQPRARLEHKVRIEQVKLLAVVLSQNERQGCRPDRQAGSLTHLRADMVEPDFEAGWAYLAALMRERFGTEDIKEISDEVRPRFYFSGAKKGQPTGEEKSDLECLRDTLDARINDQRNERGGGERGWSIHDLKTAAGVECFCATHCRGRVSREVAKVAKEGVMA